jgi:hypothetical protein
MKTSLTLLILCIAIASCKQKNLESGISDTTYITRDYLTVRKYLDTLNAKMQGELDSTGSYTIPYTDLTNGKKRLVFIGASHGRSVGDPQFTLIEKVFKEANPEIAFNEGGQIPEDRIYPSLDSAVRHDGETGCLKYLCDEAHIKMLNGDMDDQEEFAALQKTIPKDQIHLYMAVERFLNPYKHGRYNEMTLEEAYQKKFIAYLDRSKFILTDEEKSFPYLQKLYKHHLNQELVLDSLLEVHEYYLIDECIFGNVGRATKEVRDHALLKKIDEALNKYDRVFVVFGGSHRIAVEPALKQIIRKNR